MFNLLSFYYKDSFKYQRKDTLDHIKYTLKYQLDRCHYYNWSSKNTIIKTNFDFEYKDFKAVRFDFNKPLKNLFFSKIIAAYEVLSQYPDSIVWQHDHDTFQIKPFPDSILLSHEINMCSRWQGNSLANSASIFYNGMSKSIKDMYEYIQIPSPLVNKVYGDEDIFIHFQKLGYSITTGLSFEYNTSLTKYTSDRRKSDDPYCVHGDIFRKRWDSRRYNAYLKKSSFKPNKN
jgi:hypothetical protein